MAACCTRQATNSPPTCSTASSSHRACSSSPRKPLPKLLSTGSAVVSAGESLPCSSLRPMRQGLRPLPSRAGATTCAAGAVCTVLNDCMWDRCWRAVPLMTAPARRLLAVCPRGCVRTREHGASRDDHPYPSPSVTHSDGAAGTHHHGEWRNADWVTDPRRSASRLPLLPAERR